jgi:uncharacterized protein (UPF0333 family)
MNNKAQASLEYLLLIAGAVLAAAIVIVIMVSSITSSTDAQHTFHEKYHALSHSTIFE